MSAFGFHSEYIYPDLIARESWFRSLLKVVKNYDLVFLDPDNRIEVPSVKKGTKKSNKYVYLCELERIWENNKSFLFFQHFSRVNRDKFIADLTSKVKVVSYNSVIPSFKATNIVLFLALQPPHQKYKEKIIRIIKEKWQDEFAIRDD